MGNVGHDERGKEEGERGREMEIETERVWRARKVLEAHRSGP